MNYLLDTNACISYLNNPQSPVRYQLERLDRNDVFMCSVVKAELYFGVMNSQRPTRAATYFPPLMATYFSPTPYVT